MALSAQAINVVKATAPVVAEHALQITSTFYGKMFKNNPEVNHFFNAAHQAAGRQPRALADSVIQYALNIENLGELGPLVEKIAHRHCALSVKPEHYGIVHSNLMLAIGEVLGDAVTPEIGEGWSEAVLALADICIGAEEEIYKQAESKVGGWRYEREFEVSKKADVAEDTVALAFTAADGYGGVFDYDAGQYLTLRIPETEQAPRHYCLSGKPNEGNALEIAVRREEGGLYSNYVHDNLKVGDKVLLGAPMGVFGNPEKYSDNMAFVAGGIGVTPMLSFIGQYGDRVKAGVVVNQKESRSAFVDELNASPTDVRFFNTREGSNPQRPNIENEVDDLIKAAGLDADFFLCGPDGLMDAANNALAARGAKNVHINIYGTGTLATNLEADRESKCPLGH